MTVTNYVVPHEGFGDPRRLSVNNVDPDLFIELLAEAGDSQQVTVTLCGHSSSGFRVRHNDTVVGTISVAQSADYSELDWIMSSGLSPQVTATVSLCQDCEDDTTPVFEVLLPEPGLCVPGNNPPAERWGLLEGDTPLHVTDFDTPDHALPNQSAHLLVRVENKHGMFRRYIQLFVDTTLIATISSGEAEWLAQSITDLDREGLIAVTRAYYSVDNGRPKLTIFTHDATTGGVPVLKTAGVLAAASAGTAIAVARAEAKGATSPSPFVGAAPSPHSPTISLSPMESAAKTASLGSKFAEAGAGLKLACAASVAVIIGGTANFAASLVSLNSSQEHVTGSALEAYNNPHINPRAAGDVNAADSTGVEDPEWSDESTSHDTKPDRFWDIPSRLRDALPHESRDASSGDTTVLADVPTGSARVTGTGTRSDATPERSDSNPRREGRTSPTAKTTRAQKSAHRTATQDAPRHRERHGTDSDSAPIRGTDRGTAGTAGTAATAARPTHQAQPQPKATPKPTPKPTLKPSGPTVAPAPSKASPQPAPRPAPQPAQTPTAPIGQDRTPSDQDRSPIGQDRTASEEGQVIVPFVPTLPPHATGTDEPTPDIPEDVTVIPAAPLKPAATVEPSTPVSTPQEPTPAPSAAEEPTTAPSATQEPTTEEPTPVPSATEKPTTEEPTPAPSATQEPTTCLLYTSPSPRD